MKNFFSQMPKALGMLLLSLLIVACSDTDGPPEDLFGIVAAGEPVDGMIYVIDANGTELSRPINADGTYRFDVRQLTAPFMLKAVANNGVDPDLYSYSEEVNATVNVTPLTNLAVYIANGEADPAVLYDSWSSSFVNISDTVIKNAIAVVNANLRAQLTAYSLDPYTHNFVNTGFLANGTGFDALLGRITVDLSSGISVVVDQIAPFVFDTAIDVSAYDIGGVNSIVAGEYTVTLNFTVDGVAATSGLYLSYYMPAADLPVDGSTQMVEDMFVSYFGSVGTIVINSVTVTVVDTTKTEVAIDATITTDYGTTPNYIVTYTYSLNQ